MRFLLIGKEMMATSLGYRLFELEGHDVRIWIGEKEHKDHLRGMVPQVQSLQEGLLWLGRRKDAYIIADDETDMTRYRSAGFKAYGGNAFIARLEKDRAFQMEVCEKAGLHLSNWHAVKNINEAIQFVKQNPDQYVLKQTGHLPKQYNYVGREEDGSDMLDQLNWMREQEEFKKLGGASFILQEFVEGIELGCSAYWQQNDWYRNEDGSLFLALNKEHKKQLDGDGGITCGEMGTAGMLLTEHRLFDEVLDKLTPVIRKYASDVSINVDVNCLIAEEENGPVPYLAEVTARPGYPWSSLEEFLLKTECAEFFSSLIDGTQPGVEWKYGWGIVVVVGAGLFPHETPEDVDIGSFKDQPVYFKNGLTENIAPHYLYYDEKASLYRIADDYEDVCGVCSVAETPMKANTECLKIIEDEIEVRSIQYRRDVGTKFEQEEMPKLKELGYLPEYQLQNEGNYANEAK